MPTTTVSASVCVGRKLFMKPPKTKDSLNAIAKWRLQSANCKVILRTLITVPISCFYFAFFNLHSALCIEPLRFDISYPHSSYLKWLTSMDLSYIKLMIPGSSIGRAAGC